MENRFPLWLGHVLALIFSPLAAFFVVFNVLFSDVFGVPERLGTFLYVAGVYAVFGFLFAWVWPRKHWTWVLWFGILEAAVVLLYSLTEWSRVLLHVGVLLLAIVAVWGGALLGRRLAERKLPPEQRSKVQWKAIGVVTLVCFVLLGIALMNESSPSAGGVPTDAPPGAPFGY